MNSKGYVGIPIINKINTTRNSPFKTKIKGLNICNMTNSIFYHIAAAAAKSFQSCPTLCDPKTAAHQAPPSPGFSGKNTGVGCHFLLKRMKVKSENEVAQSCPTLSDPMDL